jgi:hypothetical protein
MIFYAGLKPTPVYLILLASTLNYEISQSKPTKFVPSFVDIFPSILDIQIMASLLESHV